MSINSENLKSTYSCPEIDNSTANCLKDFFANMLTLDDNILSQLSYVDSSDYDHDYNSKNGYRRKNRFFNTRKKKSKVGNRRRFDNADVL